MFRPSLLTLTLLFGCSIRLGSAGLFSDIVQGVTGFGSDEDDQGEQEEPSQGESQSLLSGIVDAIIPEGIVDGVTSLLSEEDQGVHFYQENTFAMAQMMLDFVDTPLYLVSLFQYRENAIYEDGRATNLTGLEADKLYTKAVLSELLPQAGGELVYIANVEKTSFPLTDSESQNWHAMSVLYFPNSRAFGRMVANPKFLSLSVHKTAGLQDTLVFACELVPGSSMEAVEMVANGFGTTEDAGPVATMELLDYQGIARYQSGDTDAAYFRPGDQAAQLYDDVAVPEALSLGMRVAAEFEIKSSLIQSSLKSYDELRIYTWPNHAALQAFQNDDKSNPAKHHFEAGVDQAMSLQVSPVWINSLGGNSHIGYYEACSKAAVQPRLGPSFFCPSCSMATVVVEEEEPSVDPSFFCP